MSLTGTEDPRKMRRNVILWQLTVGDCLSLFTLSSRLKIRWWQHRAGSSPARGTNKIHSVYRGSELSLIQALRMF
jgi:hypothetical protein